MSQKLLLLSALAALFLALPADLRAQDGKKDDEKKSDGEKKTPEAAKKTLALGEKPAAWKDGKPASGPVKALYKTDAAEGDAEGGTVQVRFLGPKATWDRQLDFYSSRYEDKDGKKLEKSALKQDAFEANGVKVQLVDVAGTFVPAGKRDDAAKPAKKPGQETIGCLLQGPDGAWAVAIWGQEKSVEKAREDFMKFVKSVKVVEKPADGGDDKPAKPRKKKEDEGD